MLCVFVRVYFGSVMGGLGVFFLMSSEVMIERVRMLLIILSEMLIGIWMLLRIFYVSIIFMLMKMRMIVRLRLRNWKSSIELESVK